MHGSGKGPSSLQVARLPHSDASAVGPAGAQHSSVHNPLILHLEAAVGEPAHVQARPVVDLRGGVRGQASWRQRGNGGGAQHPSHPHLDKVAPHPLPRLAEAPAALMRACGRGQQQLGQLCMWGDAGIFEATHVNSPHRWSPAGAVRLPSGWKSRCMGVFPTQYGSSPSQNSPAACLNRNVQRKAHSSSAAEGEGKPVSEKERGTVLDPNQSTAAPVNAHPG